jgi:hypothetical protein
VTYEAYLTVVKKIRHAYDHWRAGQVCFGALSHYAPSIAEKIRGTALDPFYNDLRIPAFFEFLKTELPHE